MLLPAYYISVINAEVNKALMPDAADKIWLDPTTEEAKESKGCCTLSCVPALGLVTNIWQTGQMKIDELLQVCYITSQTKHVLRIFPS